MKLEPGANPMSTDGFGRLIELRCKDQGTAAKNRKDHEMKLAGQGISCLIFTTRSILNLKIQSHQLGDPFLLLFCHNMLVHEKLETSLICLYNEKSTHQKMTPLLDSKTL